MRKYATLHCSVCLFGIYLRPIGTALLFSLILACTGYSQSFTTCYGQTVLSITGPNSSTITNNTGSAVTVRISAKGGGGGTGYHTTSSPNQSQGGEGATIIGEFVMQPGETIRAIAGGRGEDAACLPTCSSNTGSGGGGGSGAVNCGFPSDCANGNILLIAAAGRGGYQSGGGSSGLGGLATLTECGDGGLTSGGRAGGGGGCSSSGANSSCATGGGQVDKSGLSPGGTKCSTCTSCGNGAEGMGGGGGGSISHGGGGGGGDKGGVGASGSVAANSRNTGSNQTNTSGAKEANSSAGTVEIVCLQALPVELVSFKALQKAENVQLTWQTASEMNNLGFEIERSMDAVNWRQIAFLSGQGTTDEEHTYSFTDWRPLTGVNYYRLKQVDFDGSFTYSRIINVDMRRHGSNFTIFPNPAKSSVTLIFDSKQTGDATLSLYDFTGRLVKLDAFSVEGSGFRTEIGLESLTAGVYLAKMNIGNEQWWERLIME